MLRAATCPAAAPICGGTGRDGRRRIGLSGEDTEAWLPPRGRDGGLKRVARRFDDRFSAIDCTCKRRSDSTAASACARIGAENPPRPKANSRPFEAAAHCAPRTVGHFRDQDRQLRHLVNSGANPSKLPSSLLRPTTEAIELAKLSVARGMALLAGSGPCPQSRGETAIRKGDSPVLLPLFRQCLTVITAQSTFAIRRQLRLTGTPSMSKEEGAPPRTFRVDARALLSLGRESIKDNTTALLELVKNAYDADAENVDVEVLAGEQPGLIRVADDGVGMTSADINHKWLRIGYSAKRKNRVSRKGRRETGEKGIGRLSADRLGSSLELRSRTSEGDVAIAVNWDDFDTDDAEIGSIEIRELDDRPPSLPSHGRGTATSGTEIRVTHLRQLWSDKDLEDLEIELSTLVPPSQAGDFAIWLRTPASAKYKKLAPPFQGLAELVFTGKIAKNGRLTYCVSERPRKEGGRRKVIAKDVVSCSQLIGDSRSYSIGPVQLELRYYIRSGVDLKGFTLTQLRDYLDTFGGVRIYRDNVRVKPYGSPNHPEGDWLGLSERKVRNPAGAGRSDFRIAANQLVGVVHIGRDANPKLADSAAREGLVHGEAYATLKRVMFQCVVLLESLYHKRFVERKGEEAPPARPVPLLVDGLKTTIADVQKSLTQAQREKSAASAAALIEQSVQHVASLARQVTVAERELEELAGQATVYRGLATVGISAAVFGHETESSLSLATSATGLALDVLGDDPPDTVVASEELSKALCAIKKVAVWGQFALARVRMDKRKRKKVNVSRLISRLVADIGPLFAASRIDLDTRIEDDVEMRAFPMDVEALVLNLLTNAYHAAGSVRSNRKVRLTFASRQAGLRRSAHLKVSDSGLGIPKHHIDKIWLPLFSTRTDDSGRPVGTGLGLTIVKSISGDLGATVKVLGTSRLGGAAFEVLIPLKG